MPPRRRDPYRILARSVAAFIRAQSPTAGSVPAEDERLGTALADLAVTGRRSYCLLATPARTPLHELSLIGAGNQVDLGTDPYTEPELHAKVGGLLPPGVSTTPEQLRIAIDTALDRAFTVAWALRGPLVYRTTARGALDWIAVSGEDDVPHRPTNVPAPPFEQYEIPVEVPKTDTHKALTLQTRFFISSPPAPPSVRRPETLRTLPPDPEPFVPAGNNVIVFLHGHVSGAEEALALVPYIHHAGQAAGKRFSVISVDLPNSGYSEAFHHEKIATSDATIWPSDPFFDHDPIGTPVLDFIEDFVVAFVDALDDVTPIKDQFSGVIGGSLGGNLGLRLGRRSPMPDWLDTGIVSWNAASVWDPMVNDNIKSIAPSRCQANWEASESEESRFDYFHEVYDKVVDPVFITATQPALWYREGWEPCKRLHITGSRRARRETYSANLRQWHWRVAAEQLIYSHVDRVVHGDNSTPWRYENNVVRHLLIAGEEDHFTGTNIYEATRTLAGLMTATPGQGMFLRQTGHSVHFERPRFLADSIVVFLPSDVAPPQGPTEVVSLEITCVTRAHPRSGRVLEVCGTNHTEGVPFCLTVDECVDFIDFGCEVYVRKADGGRTAVHVVRKKGMRPYVATAPDRTDDNNLLSLPAC